jgi:hypothetical protein
MFAMAFWSKWFKAPIPCERCGEPIDGEPVEFRGAKIHTHCHAAIVEAERRRAEQDRALQSLESRSRIPQRAPTPLIPGTRTPSPGGYVGEEGSSVDGLPAIESRGMPANPGNTPRTPSPPPPIERTPTPAPTSDDDAGEEGDEEPEDLNG